MSYIPNLSSATRWEKFTVNYTDLSAASTTASYTFYTAPAGTFISGAIMSVYSTFTGGSVSTSDIELDVFTSGDVVPSSNIMANSIYQNYPQLLCNLGGTQTVYATLTVTGGNTQDLTQGRIYIWLQVSQLPDII